jgi:hypothetical protein
MTDRATRSLSANASDSQSIPLIRCQNQRSAIMAEHRPAQATNSKAQTKTADANNG